MAKSKKVKKSKSLDEKIEDWAEDFSKSVEKKAKNVKNRGALITSLVLISIGLIFLLSDLNIITFNPFYIVLLVGVAFLAAYLLTSTWAFIIPGVIISLTSLVLLTNSAGVWYLWTGIVALAFLAVYATGQKWAMIPGGILLAITLMNALEYYTNVSSFPIILIIIGVYLILKNRG